MASKWFVSGTLSRGKPNRPEMGGANPSSLKIYLHSSKLSYYGYRKITIISMLCTAILFICGSVNSHLRPSWTCGMVMERELISMWKSWCSWHSMSQAVAALQRNIESCLATRTLEGRLGHVPKVGSDTKKHENHQGWTKVGPRLDQGWWCFPFLFFIFLFFSSFVVRIRSWGLNLLDGESQNLHPGFFFSKAELKNHKMTRHQWGQKRWMKLDYIADSGHFNHVNTLTLTGIISTYIYAHMS